MTEAEKSKIYKGVDRPFEVMGLEGMFAIAAAVSILLTFILVVILCLLLDSKLFIIIFFSIALSTALRVIFHLNKHSSVRELQLKYSAINVDNLSAK